MASLKFFRFRNVPAIKLEIGNAVVRRKLFGDIERISRHSHADCREDTIAILTLLSRLFLKPVHTAITPEYHLPSGPGICFEILVLHRTYHFYFMLFRCVTGQVDSVNLTPEIREIAEHIRRIMHIRNLGLRLCLHANKESMLFISIGLSFPGDVSLAVRVQADTYSDQITNDLMHPTGGDRRLVKWEQDDSIGGIRDDPQDQRDEFGLTIWGGVMDNGNQTNTKTAKITFNNKEIQG